MSKSIRSFDDRCLDAKFVPQAASQVGASTPAGRRKAIMAPYRSGASGVFGVSPARPVRRRRT